MTTVFLALGSNKGDRLHFLRKAVDLISKEDVVVRRSSIYETIPYGVTDQPEFLNAVIEVITTKTIYDLFKYLKTVESETGRTPSVRWGEREIDIDIIYFGNEVVDEENLHVPHKGVTERDFVLEPLNEIAPYFIHPVFKKTPTELLKKVSGKNIIRIFPEKF